MYRGAWRASIDHGLTAMKSLFCVRLKNGDALEVYPGFSVGSPFGVEIMRTVKLNVRPAKDLTGVWNPPGLIAEFTFERVAETHVDTGTIIFGKPVYDIVPVALYWLSNVPPTGWCWIVHPTTMKFLLTRSAK